ncbi:MAG: Hsp70 family protein [Myxococcales bacterium]|nr:Hsp70 family protein [Myxococcales bacterium]MCB9645962.1 Hsp70 family protein [Deltaproteobacteria bacterium]
MWAIDLGTTNTGVARWSEAEARPRLVELAEVCRSPGSEDHLEAPLLVPTLVHAFEQVDFWARVGQWPPLAKSVFWGHSAVIGKKAQDANRGKVSPSFARSFKPFLGRSPLRTLARVGKRPISARDVARLFIRELLFEVKEATGERIRDLVVTTPVEAYESYRAELSAIFKAFGVRRVRFLDEPVAAALGYGLTLKQNRVALVVDFGGGTLDVAAVSLTAKGVAEGNCEVLGKEGRPLGGNLVDRWLMGEFCQRLGYPVPKDADDDDASLWTRMMLEETCRVKEAVFFREKEVFVPTPPDELARFEERIRGESSTLTVTREDVQEILRKRGLYDALSECVDGALAQARQHGVDEADVEDVLMVGGSTLLPGVYPALEERFGRDRVRAWQPFEAVAYGAAVFAADASQQSDFIVHDYAFVTHDLKTHEKQYAIIVPHGTRFPTATDFWKRQLVPTCSLGEPETMFKLVICEVGRDYEGDRKFTWDAEGRLHKLGGREGASREPLVVPLNESNPTLGYLKPPHMPNDKRPRLEISFGVNADRWLCATVYDLYTKRFMMREEPVVRLL